MPSIGWLQKGASLKPRPLPHVDPLARPSLLRRILVALAGCRPMRALSRTAVWRNTTWRLGPLLLRLTGGRLHSGLGLPTALLETRGARTGLPRRNEIIYFHDGDDVIVIASQAGYPGNPSWYYNVLANPKVRFGGQEFLAVAVEDDASRRRLWALADRVFPAFVEYRTSAAGHGRKIPIIRLRAANVETHCDRASGQHI